MFWTSGGFVLIISETKHRKRVFCQFYSDKTSIFTNNLDEFFSSSQIQWHKLKTSIRGRPLIANCVFNAFLSCIAIMLNIITIQALRKSSSLAKPLKTLLLSLAVSDLGVGLLAQPLYIAFLVTKMKQNTNNNIYNTINEAHPISSHIFAGASFFGIIALSADRFLAIHLHLRYQELVTHKRVVAAVISIWLFSVFLSLIVNLRWIPRENEWHYFYNCSGCLLHNYRIALLQDICSRTTPHKSNSSPASTASSNKWWNGK